VKDVTILSTTAELVCHLSRDVVAEMKRTCITCDDWTRSRGTYSRTCYGKRIL